MFLWLEKALRWRDIEPLKKETFGDAQGEEQVPITLAKFLPCRQGSHDFMS